MNIVSPEKVGLSSTRLNRIGEAMQGYVDKGQPPGMITLVARRGKVAHLQCFGMMDVEAGKPMQRDTIFRIYSMTKPIASIALMMLFEAGHFVLDDPVSRFILEFSDLKVFVRSTATGVELADLEREMTIWNLLTHTAGLGYALLEDTPVEDMYRGAGMLDPLRVLQVSLQDMVQALAKLPLAHQPGSDWRYSFAHDVIGYLVGLISDMPLLVRHRLQPRKVHAGARRDRRAHQKVRPVTSSRPMANAGKHRSCDVHP